MNGDDINKALSNLSGTGLAGGAGGALLGAAIGAASRYSKEPGEKSSILTNPLLLGALGAGLGYAGGSALDHIDTPSVSTSERLNPGTWLTGGLLSTAGLYGVGASSASRNAEEIIDKYIKLRRSSLSRLPSGELNKYIRALALKGRVEKNIVNDAVLHGAAEKLGITGRGPLSNWIRYHAFSPKNAFGRGLFFDAPSRLIKNITKGNLLGRIGSSLAQHPIKSIGKAAPAVAALTGLGILGKKIFVDD